MGSGYRAFDIGCGFAGLGATPARAYLGRIDAVGQLEQFAGNHIGRSIAPVRPFVRRQRDEHALILAANLQGKVIRRDLGWRCTGFIGCSMGSFNTALERGQHVVRQHRDGKTQQRGPRMTQGADLALQHRLESLEHAFDTPALAI
ncbi:hypothetical protein R75461_08503 [Paraburkholderia nemoris]|nr:hypothetical protein R75461_08503 [Paraburkholderia nemoris]